MKIKGDVRNLFWQVRLMSSFSTILFEASIECDAVASFYVGNLEIKRYQHGYLIHIIIIGVKLYSWEETFFISI